MKTLITIFGLVVAGSIGCTGSTNNEEELLALAALATGPVTMPVALVNNGQSVSCNQSFSMGGNGSVQIRDFRLYLSEFAWVTPSGEVSATVPDVQGWQKDGTVLIDLEDATGLCSSSGTADTNGQIIIGAPPADATALSFSVGLPVSQNRLDNTTADSPFNVTAMYWSWTTGYKFTKMEFSDGSDVINFHLGSRTCTGGAGNITCAQEMKGRVTVAGVNAAAGIQFDLADWFTGQTYGANVCMGNASTDGTLCAAMRNRMGLVHDTGVALSDNALGFEVR